VWGAKRSESATHTTLLTRYHFQISDLLKPERNNLAIREDKKKGVFVEGLSEWVVRSPAEIYGLMERGGSVRATGSTKMNELSSRSHAVFIIIVEQSQTIVSEDEGGGEGGGGSGSGRMQQKQMQMQMQMQMQQQQGKRIKQSFKVKRAERKQNTLLKLN